MGYSAIVESEICKCGVYSNTGIRGVARVWFPDNSNLLFMLTELGCRIRDLPWNFIVLGKRRNFGKLFSASSRSQISIDKMMRFYSLVTFEYHCSFPSFVSITKEKIFILTSLLSLFIPIGHSLTRNFLKEPFKKLGVYRKNSLTTFHYKYTKNCDCSLKNLISLAPISRVSLFLIHYTNFILILTSHAICRSSDQPQTIKNSFGGGKKKIKPRTDTVTNGDLLKIRRAYRQVTNDKRMQSECGKQILSGVNVATGHQREIDPVWMDRHNVRIYTPLPSSTSSPPPPFPRLERRNDW